MKVIYTIPLIVFAIGLGFFFVVNILDDTRPVRTEETQTIPAELSHGVDRLPEGVQAKLDEKNARLELERQNRLERERLERENVVEPEEVKEKITVERIVKTGFLQNGALVVPKKIGEIELLRPNQLVNGIYFLEEKINGVDYWVFGPNQYVEPVESVYVEYIYNIQREGGIITGILNDATFPVTAAVSFDTSYNVEVPFSEREVFADFLADYKRITGRTLDVSDMEIGIYHQQKENITNGSSLSHCDDDRADIIVNTKKLKKSGREGESEDWITSWKFTFYHELTHDILNLDHWFREHGAPTDNLLGTSAYPRFYLDSDYRDSLLTAAWTNPNHPNICHKN